MFRNNYDNDNTTWSPVGRIFQIEYAMEAVKQGSAAVGLKSKTHVVLVTLKRSASELSQAQRKVFKIDEHCGVAIAGLTSDARVLSKYMRTECLNHRYVFDEPLQIFRLVSAVAEKSTPGTMQYGRRPYGVGLLVAGYDATGAHLYQTDPSANFYDYYAMAIGARSQSAKTYLEKHFSEFPDCSEDELIRHALLALRETVQGGKLEARSTSLAIVGRDTPFRLLEDDALAVYIDRAEAGAPPVAVPARPTPAADAAAATGGPDDMQV